MSRLIRVFPRKTSQTPEDDLSIVGLEPTLWDEADEVHVSVTFEWDKAEGERLAKEWECVTSNVKVGGPAYGDRGGDFVSGRYLKPGNTITSRGCPNHCWFCDAWKREGDSIRVLPIVDGWNVQDNNLLACPEEHITAVFEMLGRQKRRPSFSGGLEADRLTIQLVDDLVALKPEMIWFAYDEPIDYEPLCVASEMMRSAGLMKKGHHVGCYVLCGWEGDAISSAEYRMKEVVRLGYFPQAMLYDRGLHYSLHQRKLWRQFARGWAAKPLVGAKMREMKKETEK